MKTSAFSAAALLTACFLVPTSADAAVTSYQLTGVFDSAPEVYAYDNNLGQDLDTTEWGLTPQLFGQQFTLTFDVDEATPLTSITGVFTSFYNFDGAASNVSLVVGGIPFASAASGDVRQVVASASHTWSLDSTEATLAGPPLELFDYANGFPPGFMVERPFLSLGLFDSDQNAYGPGAPDALITLSEAVFLGDAPIGFITDSLTLFLSGPEDAEVSIDYSLTGAISSISVVPEPSSLALLGLGGIVFARRRRG